MTTTAFYGTVKWPDQIRILKVKKKDPTYYNESNVVVPKLDPGEEAEIRLEF